MNGNGKEKITMSILTLKVLDQNGSIKCVDRGEDYASLVYTSEYEEGDRIILVASEKNISVILQLDDAMGPAFVYITDQVSYPIPFGEKRICYSPKAFYGKRHYMYVKRAGEEEGQRYANLALNVYDGHGDTNCYPHASANVETRGESVFAARNAIDGVCENRSHGEWPYESWGINQRADAEMRVDFGREIETDKIVLYTRSDFPHDSWWTQATLTFSDGSMIKWDMEKSSKPHVLTFEKKKITWVSFSNLIKADDPSPFPALSQIEVYGTVV